jgi:trimethylamine--corrinoid protein Co-methyltransferase
MIRLATGQVDIGIKPTVSCHISPSAPLQWTPEACEIILSTVAHGVPFYILPSPMAGATSPVTLAGYIVQHNTQILSGIVIAQVLKGRISRGILQRADTLQYAGGKPHHRNS